MVQSSPMLLKKYLKYLHIYPTHTYFVQIVGVGKNINDT